VLQEEKAVDSSFMAFQGALAGASLQVPNLNLPILTTAGKIFGVDLY